MINLRSRNSEAYDYLLNGGFTGSLSGSNHSNIPCDQLIETTINRFSKSVDGILGKTEDVGACEKWVRLNQYMCALKEHLDKKVRRNTSWNGHVELGKT